MPAPAASTGRVSAADSPSVCSPAAAAHVCDCDVRDGRRDREASTHTHKSTTLVCTIPYTIYCTLQMGARLVQCTWLEMEYCCLYTKKKWVCILFYFTVHKAQKTTAAQPTGGRPAHQHLTSAASRANTLVRLFHAALPRSQM